MGEVPLWGSVITGSVVWGVDADFAIVEGSTDDPYPPGFNSWISVWEDTYGPAPSVCASSGFPAGFVCTPDVDLLGGHVIAGKQASSMDRGDDVYVIPICNAHNNDDQIYMQATENQQVIQLSYLEIGSEFPGGM